MYLLDILRIFCVYYAVYVFIAVILSESPPCTDEKVWQSAARPSASVFRFP